MTPSLSLSLGLSLSLSLSLSISFTLTLTLTLTFVRPTVPPTLRSLLGMAVLLKRQLVLPAALCACRERALTQCEGEAVAPFGCPLRRGLALPASLWQRHPYLLAHNVTLRPASTLLDRSAASERVRASPSPSPSP